MSKIFPRAVPNVIAPDVKLIHYLLLKKGPLTTIQLFDIYPETGSTWHLKWKILHPLRREGLIAYHWYRDPSNLQKSVFLWTLPWIHSKNSWEQAGRLRIEELENEKNSETLELEKLEHKLIPKQGPVRYKDLLL